jgi:hypothetical protein
VTDLNGNGENHGVARDIVIREAREAGYQLLGQDDFVKEWNGLFSSFWRKIALEPRIARE